LPDGRVLESCKNAATQQAWRNKKKAEKLQAEIMNPELESAKGKTR
jgi:hypothetical protein